MDKKNLWLWIIGINRDLLKPCNTLVWYEANVSTPWCTIRKDIWCTQDQVVKTKVYCGPLSLSRCWQNSRSLCTSTITYMKCWSGLSVVTLYLWYPTTGNKKKFGFSEQFSYAPRHSDVWKKIYFGVKVLKYFWLEHFLPLLISWKLWNF